MSETTKAINSALRHIKEAGASPDRVYMKGTAYEKLRDELNQGRDKIFGIDIHIKADDQFPEGTHLMVVDSENAYPKYVEEDI